MWCSIDNSEDFIFLLSEIPMISLETTRLLVETCIQHFGIWTP
jgi:hypothetical protein